MKSARTRALHRKHAGTGKHTSAKHTPTAHKKAATAHRQAARRVALSAKHAHARAFSPDADVACCTARAFAESLRLALGVAVSDSAVLDLYWATADGADAGASILATAGAVSAGGLGGCFPALLAPVHVADPDPGGLPARHRSDAGLPGLQAVRTGTLALKPGHVPGHALILGVAGMPAPHTVAVGPDGTWWSWGQPFDPAAWPALIVEEAWAVTWA